MLKINASTGETEDISLFDLLDGGVKELAALNLKRVLDNIADLNTDAKKTRTLCTFSEIEQPARRFVFRLRPGRSEGDGVQAALFDADGTAWRREAILSIRDWFTDKLPDELRDEVIILA